MSQSSNPNPFLRANKWSQLFHSWITTLITISHTKKTLHLDDVYDILPAYQSEQLTDKLENNWFDQLKRHPNKPSLLRATIVTMGWKPILIGCLLIPTNLMIVLRPLLIIYLMDFFQPCSSMSVLFAGLLTLGIVIVTAISTFCHHQFYQSLDLYGMQMRAAHYGLIYRKVLRLSNHSLSTFGSGQITNIFSNDATQIQMLLVSFNYFWVAPIDMLAMIIFFWYFIKYISLIAIAYTIVVVLLFSLLGHCLVYFRTKVLEVTDERVKTMSEIIKSMRIVKMYCWEAAFDKKIRSMRRHEILRYGIGLIFNSIQTITQNSYTCVTFLIIYAILWSSDARFDTRFFTAASCMLSHLEVSLIEFGFAVRDFVHYLTAEKRMTSFLLFDESERDRRLASGSFISTEVDSETKKVHSLRIECKLTEAHWKQKSSFSLKNIAFTAHPGDLICVIGPVGSGKSSLLQTLTGEIAYFDGKVRLGGSFCYVPQESWIFPSTIKNNILFGKEYDDDKFRRVIHAAALETDFVQLRDGANTLVGDQGVMLSGGQKARVNMARALYRDADIYLLDDPLSAVDAKVSKQLFERSIQNYLRDKICILVTHQVQFLQDATKILVLNQGELVEMGTYTELLNSSLAFRQLLENIHQHEQEGVSNDIRPGCSTRAGTFSQADNEQEQLLEDYSLETKEEGSIKWRVFVDYLKAGTGLLIGLVLLLLVFGAQEVIDVLSVWWLAGWSEDEGHRHQPATNCSTTGTDKIHRMQSMDTIQWNNHRNAKFYTYCGIAAILVISTAFRDVLLRLTCLNASRVLHNRMFGRLLRCPISFFDLNPVGRIVNRFTKDVAIVDEQLPSTLFDFLQCLFQVLGMTTLVIWITPWSIIPAVISVIGMLYIRHRYSRCSRDLKRLEGATRSPLYSYLTSTIHGLSVLRSYHAENICLSEFFAHLDDNTRTNYLFLTTNRWAGIRFDWLTLFFVAAVTVFCILLRLIGRQFSAADIALTLSFSVNLMGLLQWTIRQSVEVETQMTSVERILEYCALDQEPSAVTRRSPPNWPSQGRITFDNVSMSHSKDQHAPLALHHLSLTIDAGEKIGIVGRTGAGKSSFIQTLFRMGTLVDGHIIIDDIDIDTVTLDDVRRRLSIIPQDPVLFTGTMRSNLDQFGHYSDAEIWNALEQVQLKRLVTDVMSNGLQSMVSEGGSNLSVGQKQLVCLARAILKKSRILVIDEATANVDNATDELIQKAIREKFKECTVLTVAHRLRTVIDNDRILVLSDGKVVEFDSPEVLLSNEQSEFASLVKQTGYVEAKYLHTLVNHKIKE